MSIDNRSDLLGTIRDLFNKKPEDNRPDYSITLPQPWNTSTGSAELVSSRYEDLSAERVGVLVEQIGLVLPVMIREYYDFQQGSFLKSNKDVVVRHRRFKDSEKMEELMKGNIHTGQGLNKEGEPSNIYPHDIAGDEAEKLGKKVGKMWGEMIPCLPKIEGQGGTTYIVGLPYPTFREAPLAGIYYVFSHEIDGVKWRVEQMGQYLEQWEQKHGEVSGLDELRKLFFEYETMKETLDLETNEAKISEIASIFEGFRDKLVLMDDGDIHMATGNRKIYDEFAQNSSHLPDFIKKLKKDFNKWESDRVEAYNKELKELHEDPSIPELFKIFPKACEIYISKTSVPCPVGLMNKSRTEVVDGETFWQKELQVIDEQVPNLCAKVNLIHSVIEE